MILEYFSANFMTLMIISALVVIMIVNRRLKIPTTELFYALVAVILVLTVLDFFDDFLSGELSVKPSFHSVFLRTLTDALIYVLRPVVILIELIAILPKRKYRLLCSVPTIVNAVIYFSAVFGSKIAFYITKDGWQGGPLHLCVFIVQLLYVVLLVVCSVHYFGRRNAKRSIIILMIIFIAVLDAVLEYLNLMSGQSTVVAAICVLLYYIYLASVYEQEMREIFEQKELHIARQELLLLRGQIQPDFIFNTLSIIRSLAKTDKKASAAAIDSFSFYLRAHLNAIREDTPIPLEWELECVKAYLSLVQIWENRTVELETQLCATAFELPPLVLENAVEYCVSLAQGEDEKICINTRESEKAFQVSVCANVPQTARVPSRKKHDTSLENSRKRLEIHSGGRLESSLRNGEVKLTIEIPR